MRKIFFFALLFLPVLIDFDIAFPKPVKRIPIKPRNLLTSSFRRSLDVRRESRGLFAEAQADTYVLAEYTFDAGGAGTTEGWTSHDLTAQQGLFWHVDTYRVIEGSQSLWCGHGASGHDPWCNYATLPGYGNLWDQIFESVALPATGNVHLKFRALYDSEACCDFTYVQFQDTTTAQETWVDLASISGTGGMQADYVIPAGQYPDGALKVRFRFVSDGGWSDEDGLYPSDGAFILDSLRVIDNTGVINEEYFEAESTGATTTADSLWSASAAPGFGDFAGLFPGGAVLQEDVCTMDPTNLWGFFKNSPYDYSCDVPTPHPEQPTVPFMNDRGQYIWNEIWSPLIDRTAGGTVPPSASGSEMRFKIYADLPIQNLLAFTWNARFYYNGCSYEWQSSQWFYPEFGMYKRWVDYTVDVGLLRSNPQADTLQVALGVIDLCPYYCGIYGYPSCHSHAPLFDDVIIYRVDYTGPRWTVSSAHLFQDNFPEDGSLTGTVRCDMAEDKLSAFSPNIYPGDSIAVIVSAPGVGLQTSGGPDGRADVYCYAKSTGGGVPSSMADASRWPLASMTPTTGGFYKFQCDTSYDVSGTPRSDEFCFDLNDSYFTPPDTIFFYFAATDANGATTYWSEFTGTTLDQADVEAYPMEMTCLPTGSSDILYVDNYDGYGAQPYFDSAFYLMNLHPDRYDMRAPSYWVGNGLPSRAQYSQITDVYKVIIWNSKDIEGGTGVSGKHDDVGLLLNFLDQSSTWNPGLYLTGDNIASDLKNFSGPDVAYFLTYMGYTLLGNDHMALGSGVAPTVIADMPGTIFQHDPDLGGPLPAYPDTLIAYGGDCVGVSLHQFDVMGQSGASTLEMYYDDLGPTSGAVMSQQTANANAKTARVILEGFGYQSIRDDRVYFPDDRVDHLADILQWMDTLVNITGGGPGSTPFINSLSQNYPNPFNPSTTIEFSIKEKAHVSLKIYNVLGQMVKTLSDNVMDAGKYPIRWDGKDSRGRPVASGVYFYKLVTKGFNDTKKMVLLR